MDFSYILIKKNPSIFLKGILMEAGMMDQWFRAFVTLEEDPSILSSTHMLTHNHPYHSRKTDAFF